MRDYHRWLSVLFGIFILWIAVTGLLSQFGALYRDARTAAPATAAAAAPAGFVCPESMTCRVKPDPDSASASAWVSFFHHIHAGEEFGTIGTIISILSGFALVFFAISGLWMYYVMYRNRGRRHRTGSRFFWK